MNTTLTRRIPTLFLIMALCAIMGAAAGCVTQEDYDTLNAHVLNNKQKLQELSDRQEQLQTELQETRTPIQAKQAELWAEAEQLKVQLARLQGKLDTSTHSGKGKTLQELTDEVEAMRFAMEHDLGVTLPQTGPVAGNATALNPATPMLPGATQVQQAQLSPQARERQRMQQEQTQEKADPAKALYDEAMASFKARNYQGAADMWGEFATTFKKHPMRPNAIFWKGECFYMMGKYPEAILAYEEVKAKYPKSSKYKSALLKQGISFTKLGKTSAGKLVLEDLIKRYPQSAEAKRAKTFLDQNK